MLLVEDILKRKKLNILLQTNDFRKVTDEQCLKYYI